MFHLPPLACVQLPVKMADVQMRGLNNFIAEIRKCTSVALFVKPRCCSCGLTNKGVLYDVRLCGWLCVHVCVRLRQDEGSRAEACGQGAGAHSSEVWQEQEGECVCVCVQRLTYKAVYLRFLSPCQLDSYNRKKYTWKLLYIHLLG